MGRGLKNEAGSGILNDPSSFRFPVAFTEIAPVNVNLDSCPSYFRFRVLFFLEIKTRSRVESV